MKSLEKGRECQDAKRKGQEEWAEDTEESWGLLLSTVSLARRERRAASVA